VEVRQLVDAPREEVFSALADPTTYPDWLIGAQQIRSIDDDFPAEDSSFEHSSGPNAAVTVDDSTVVVEKHGHRQLVLEAHLGPIVADVEFNLVSRGDQTEIVMRERPSGWAQVITPLVRPLLSLRNRLSLRQLAQQVAQPAA
jgi:hypothetical protein